MRPIRSACSANHRLPSGPTVMPKGNAPAVMPALNSVMTPLGVMRPIRLPVSSANHRLPSGPAVMPCAFAPAVSPLNSVTTPSGVMRPIRLPVSSVNQRLPSGPAVMPPSPAPAVMPALNSVTTCASAPPDGRQSKASMQPRRMRQVFMNRSPVTFVRRSLGSGRTARQRQQSSRAYRLLTVLRGLTVFKNEAIVGGAEGHSQGLCLCSRRRINTDSRVVVRLELSRLTRTPRRADYPVVGPKAVLRS